MTYRYHSKEIKNMWAIDLANTDLNLNSIITSFVTLGKLLKTTGLYFPYL